MGESVSKNARHCTLCCRQSSNQSDTPLIRGCIKVTIVRRRRANYTTASIHDRRKRAKSYEDVFRRESAFLRRTMRQPCELGSKLLTRNCLSYDDLTKIEAEAAVGEQTQILIDVVARKHCFVELYDILLEEESPLVDYLEIKRNSSEYVSDGEFVRKLGMRAFLTETDRKVLKRYYCYITRNTTNVDDVFTHLYQNDVIDDVTFEKLQTKQGEIAKMEYFVQSNMSRWTYQELRNFCDILMDENSHVAEVLWPIVFTADPDLRQSMSSVICQTDLETDLSVDKKCENMALKLYSNRKTHPQTSIVLGNYGDVTDVVAGSIKITIVVRTVAALKQLVSDVDTGCMQHRFKGWILSNAPRFDAACVVDADVSRSDYVHARQTLEDHENKLATQGVLETPVQFGFCKERGEWFWSHDAVVWCHVTRIRVPIGAEEGKIPRDEDVRVIQMLAKQRIPVTRPVTPCPVCTMGKLSVSSANIYEAESRGESLHAGLPVTVTFRLYRPRAAASSPRYPQPPGKVPPDLLLHTQEQANDNNSNNAIATRADSPWETDHLIYSNSWVGALPALRETTV